MKTHTCLRQQYWYGMLFTVPWLVTFVLFWLYPLAEAFLLSFSSYSTLTGVRQWVGLANYRALLDDPLFWQALRNTAIFTAGTVPITTALALILAVMLDRVAQGWFGSFLRAAYFLPTVTSLVVVSLIFTNLYARDGYINTLLQALQLPYPERGWLLDPRTALGSIMAMDVWMATGYYMVIVLAGLQTIPRQLYEAAQLSGATTWQQFKWITLPLLKPTLLFVVVMNTIKSLQVFVEVYIMTRGGPLEGTTTTLVYEVYRHAFERTDGMGYATAIAVVVFVVIVGVSWMQMQFLRSGVPAQR
ncbi:MAG: sugar ABC transporter permease [Candidatus Kapabacteria bacterium]|nr:sugar ABC transporter permease [Candidatus Kapabacteria bacterium]MCS7303184.1 sugar ABC transporter permease [Candidatus Kapabacteria bacterium]MCX7937010.1 sugar ABC transporter permease [Chlorobiota bacterium]